jgi:hypothetical protein
MTMSLIQLPSLSNQVVERESGAHEVTGEMGVLEFFGASKLGRKVADRAGLVRRRG